MKNEVQMCSPPDTPTDWGASVRFCARPLVLAVQPHNELANGECKICISRAAACANKQISSSKMAPEIARPRQRITLTCAVKMAGQ